MQTIPQTLDAIGGSEKAFMNHPVRGDYMLHVDVQTILNNKQNGVHDPVVVARHIDEIDQPAFMREAFWNGPSRFVHHDFQKIEGTNVQNWVETDASLTCFCDFETVVVMPDRNGSAAPMFDWIRGRRVIHVAAPVLSNNRKTGANDPVIAVRNVETDWASDVIFCRRVEWNGPSRLCHRPTTPIPGTNGRGVAFVETDAVLTLYVDGRPPIILH